MRCDGTDRFHCPHLWFTHNCFANTQLHQSTMLNCIWQTLLHATLGHRLSKRRHIKGRSSWLKVTFYLIHPEFRLKSNKVFITFELHILGGTQKECLSFSNKPLWWKRVLYREYFITVSCICGGKTVPSLFCTFLYLSLTYVRFWTLSSFDNQNMEYISRVHLKWALYNRFYILLNRWI